VPRAPLLRALRRFVRLRGHGFLDDLAQLTAAERAELLTAFDSYGLLLFRGREISLDEQHSVVASLGMPLDEACTGLLHSYVSTKIDLASNHTRLHFHADYTTCPTPLCGICLYAEELPDGASSTIFADTRSAYADLDQSVRDSVAGLTATHCHPLTKQQYEIPIREQENRSDLNRRASHPVRFRTRGQASHCCSSTTYSLRGSTGWTARMATGCSMS